MRMQAASGSWKGKGTDSPLEPPEGLRPCRHPDFSLQRAMLDIRPPEATTWAEL